MTDHVSKYYVDQNGAYIGAFCGAPAPDGAVEVPSAPEHGHDTWNGSAWVENPSPRIIAQIVAKERTITERRKREAILTEEGKTWMAAIDAEIAALRAQL